VAASAQKQASSFSVCATEGLGWRCVVIGRGLAFALALVPLCAPVGAQSAAKRKGFPDDDPAIKEVKPITLNQKADGYRGIWYMNQPSDDEYKYKYSGGMGTYCAKHNPFAVYREEVKKTFFCYGGAPSGNSRRLLHMVSYYDHAAGAVARPTILLDKNTSDAHDNPVIAVDAKGYLWIFSNAHGLSRPSYIHRSKRPYDIDEFELLNAKRREGERDLPINNFSYMQAWYDRDAGFACFFTRYSYPAARTSCFMSSVDGVHWSPWQRLAAIEEGHYQISAIGHGKIATAMNYHPQGKGLNWRTNVYYLESTDWGRSWHACDGGALTLPLEKPANPALVHDYKSEGLNVYLKDIQFDAEGRPVIMFITSHGYESGPANDPRTWRLARWSGRRWDIRAITTSDNNYDMGSLYIEADGTWRLIAPTVPGPQPYNPGGEMAMWTSADSGVTWKLARQLTAGSARNHTYARRPVNAHADFYAFWADGDARAPSESSLYFCNRSGDVYHLPTSMKGAMAMPELVVPKHPTPAAAKTAPVPGGR
jgi:BNR repeat-containing family member